VIQKRVGILATIGTRPFHEPSNESVMGCPVLKMKHLRSFGNRLREFMKKSSIELETWQVHNGVITPNSPQPYGAVTALAYKYSIILNKSMHPSPDLTTIP